MKKKCIFWFFLVAVVHICIYFILGAAKSESLVPLPQYDTLLYCQAARRIVEGAPFSFSVGAATSTGTTSVLYPFVLAIPYALGFTGDWLLFAGFWLNAAFYLIFLGGWLVAIRRWVPDFRAQLLAMALLALSGNAIYSALAQSDIGLWMAVSALFLAGLALNRPWLYGSMLVLAPWVRPEGIFCGLAFIAAIPFVRENRRSSILIAAAAEISTLGVFLLNYAITGEAQFSSVANKGYLSQCGLINGGFLSVNDAIAMFRELVLALDDEAPRNMLALPLVGGLLFLIGLLTRRRETPGFWQRNVWLGALALGFLSVAQSGWQGTNMDRYMAWLLPVVGVFTATGTVWLIDRVRNRLFFPSLCTLLVLFAFAGAAAWSAAFSSTAHHADCTVFFAKECNQLMTEKASVASVAECGLVYFMPEHPMKHLSGMYSPEYPAMNLTQRLEDLKRNPERRFDYWMFNDEYSNIRGSAYCEDVFGPCLLSGPDSRALHRADWSAFDEAEKVESNGELVERLDVGYPADENRTNYKVIDRYGWHPANSIVSVGTNANGRVLVDAGRVISGGDEMSLQLPVGRDVEVVMRVRSTGNATVSDGIHTQRLHVSVGDSFALNLAVDGQVVCRVDLPCAEKGFSDVRFTIPGRMITQPVTRLGFLGDHIVFGYWFFAAKNENAAAENVENAAENAIEKM